MFNSIFLLIHNAPFHPKLAVNVERRVEINSQPKVNYDFLYAFLHYIHSDSVHSGEHLLHRILSESEE